MNVVAAIIWFIGAIIAAFDVKQAYRLDSFAGMAAWTIIGIGCVIVGCAQII